MSAPTIYRWDDPGAPNIAALLPTSSDVGKLWFHTILKACLVDGYAGKAAAGWTMPHEELAANGTRFVLENGPKTGALLFEQGFFSGGSTDMNVDTFWACRDVVDMDSPVAAFSNEREYSMRNDTAEATRFHKSSISYFGSGARKNHWICVANENTAILISFQSEASLDRGSSSFAASDDCRLYVGCAHNSVGAGTVASPDAGNFFVGGLDNNTASYSNIGSNSYWHKGIVSSVVGITGLLKEGRHEYSASTALAYMATAQALNAWLPVPMDCFHSGDSSPAGSASTDLYHLCSLVGLRDSRFLPKTIAAANEWMIAQNFQYGQAVDIGGVDYLIFKGKDRMLISINLSAGEWG